MKTGSSLSEVREGSAALAIRTSAEIHCLKDRSVKNSFQVARTAHLICPFCKRWW
jgi:hypothetical protein